MKILDELQALEDGVIEKAGWWSLPEKGDALRLVVSDYEQAARELGVEVAAVRAVADVEVGGKSGFDKKKRPKILFETHHFRKLTAHRYDKSHPHLSAPYKSKNQKASYHKDQWTVIKEAFALDHEAAVKSASWGLFQVLGEHYATLGWRHLRRFVIDMFASEGQHLRTFVGFCKMNGLAKPLKKHNWATVARGFNGAGYAANAYDVKLAAAYKRYAAKK